MDWSAWLQSLTYLALNILRRQRLPPATGYVQLLRATVLAVTPSSQLPLITRSALHRQVLTVARLLYLGRRRAAFLP